MASIVCWNNLPSVVLLEIFKMISHEERINASTTCKEWRKALFFPNFWRDLSINIYSKNDKYAVERCQFFTRSFISYLRTVRIIFSYKKNYLSQVAEVLSKLSGNRQMKKLFLYGFGKSSVNPNLRLIFFLFSFIFPVNLLACVCVCCSYIYFGAKHFKNKLILYINF